MADEKLKGYNTLPASVVDAINRGKTMEESVMQLLQDVAPAADGRALALARTNIQQGFMWLTRSLSKPEG